MKVDDDVFVRTVVLPAAVAEWATLRADLAGCLKKGKVQNDPAYRWCEPASLLFGENYPTHPWGSAYVVSASLVRTLAAVEAAGGLRRFANEDVSVGIWALALGARLLDDRRLCAETCAIASFNFSCTGVCDSAADGMARLHTACASASGPLPAYSDSPWFPYRDLNS